MDNAQYHSNPMSANNSPYPPLGGGSSLPNISPHQLQQNHSGLPAHTLPPLQASQHAQATMQSLYGGGSAPHTPRTPATPNTPNSNPMGNFGQMGAQNRGYQMMGGNYQQSQQPQPYRTSASMMPQSTTAMSHPQPIAPAPAQSRMPQTLRPMPPNGLHPMGGMQPGYGQGSMMMPNDMEPPTHVVGSQGRRGILPSAPGRPAVTTNSNGTKAAMIPAKDADGKFPCPHCTKTYLHAKHLKRHLLRHTGDRPYMCVLCRDTFSRSDILKRHFQKCSIRRGNPTGASHLSAQAHVKKQQHPGVHKPNPSLTNQNDILGLNGLNNGMNNGMGSGLSYGVNPSGNMPDNGHSLTNEQVDQLQRNDALKRMGAGGLGDRSGGSSRASFDQNYAGGLSGTMPPGMNPSLAFSMPNGQNGHSYQQAYDFAAHGNANAGPNWAPVYNSTAPDGLASQFPSQNSTHSPASAKLESSASSANGVLNTIYPTSDPTSSQAAPPQWNFQANTLHKISQKMNSFCFSDHTLLGIRPVDVHQYLTAEYLGHLLALFDHFHVHFPTIHLPTFRQAEAYEGLLLAMISIGAVYSDRLVASQVRELMDFSRAVIERKSRVLNVLLQQHNGGLPIDDLGSNPADFEEINAIFLMHVLSTWNGTPVQREKARRQFPLLVELVRKLGLTTPATGASFSILHQPNLVAENVTLNNFNWESWVRQEQRSRLLYAIYLTDTAMVIYFNATPLFEFDEVRLPLPSDDAAFDARNAQECAEALGLHGQVVAQQRNPSGTRRLKQPEMHTALQALRHQSYNLRPASTNLYSKFILIHALQVQLALAQRQMSLDASQFNPQTLNFPPSGASTPSSQNDWLTRTTVDAAGNHMPSANTSGTATPVESAHHSSQVLKVILQAFEKWKQHWDEDMSVQQPSSPSSRLGFCRDAVHFYWLTKCLLKRPGFDLQLAPDQRFSYIMQLLQVVRQWVLTDSAQRGELLGSASEIDTNYGVTDLTLDMSQLFKPINQHRQASSASAMPVMGNGSS